MPSAADLFELIFMGPGLVCLVLLPLFYIPMWMKRHERRLGRVQQLEDKGKLETAIRTLDPEIDRLRHKRDYPRLQRQLVRSAKMALLHGQIHAAITRATEAIELVRRHDLKEERPHLTLGQALARQGDDKQALTHLRKAVELLSDDAAPEEIAYAYANLAMVLHRSGDIDEALQSATQAVTAGLSIPEGRPEHTQAASGWAHLALALAQTDSGLDGRPAARKGRLIIAELDSSGALSNASEGVAMGCYVFAYAARPFGDADAAGLAREAVDRFNDLATHKPQLYARRLASAMALSALFGRV